MKGTHTTVSQTPQPKQEFGNRFARLKEFVQKEMVFIS